MIGRRQITRAAVAGLCVVAAGCGAAPKHAPTQQDAGAIATSVSDIVYECQSVAAGYVAAPDGPALARDVDTLLKSYARVSLDARLTLASVTGAASTTTLRRELALAETNLAAGCSRRQARRLHSAAG